MQYNIKGRGQPATTLVTMGVVSLVYCLHCDKNKLIYAFCTESNSNCYYLLQVQHQLLIRCIL